MEKAQCKGKKRYETHREAESARVKTRRLAGDSARALTTYRCGACDGWHLGESTKRPVQTGGIRCAARGCSVELKPGTLLCREHWRMAGASLRLRYEEARLRMEREFTSEAALAMTEAQRAAVKAAGG